MMTSVQPKPQTVYEQAFHAHLDQQRQHPVGTFPNWVEAIRQTALQRFGTLGLPSRHQEAWRFVDLGPLLHQQFQPFDPARMPALSPVLLSECLYPEAEQTRLVFVNGILDTRLSQVNGLPPGVVISELTQAFAQHPEVIQGAFAQGIAAESDAFVTQNTSAFRTGAFVFVPDNVALAQPVQVLFITQEDGDTPRSDYPRGLFIAGRNARLTVVTSFVGVGQSPAATLNNAVMEVIAGEGSTVEYVHLQDETAGGFELATTHVFLAANSTAHVSAFAFGGQLCRHNLQAQLQGENAHCVLNGLSVLTGESQVFDHTVLHHTVPHCRSEQLYKGILDGHSRSEFDGSILIAQGACQTDAAQLNQNLLLSDHARVMTRPQLKIDNDDVKCAHGATVGQLSEEELFYLTSRGIPQHQARSLLTYGFAEDIISKVSVPSLRAHLDALVHLNLGASDSDTSPGKQGESVWSV